MARCIYWKLDWLWVICTIWCWPLQCRLFATPWETGIWHVYSCICGGNKGKIKVSVKNPILLIYADVNAEINYSRLQDYHQQMEIKWSIGLACDMHIHHHRIGHLFNGNSRKIHVLQKAMCFVAYIYVTWGMTNEFPLIILKNILHASWQDSWLYYRIWEMLFGFGF